VECHWTHGQHRVTGHGHQKTVENSADLCKDNYVALNRISPAHVDDNIYLTFIEYIMSVSFTADTVVDYHRHHNIFRSHVPEVYILSYASRPTGVTVDAVSQR